MIGIAVHIQYGVRSDVCVRSSDDITLWFEMLAVFEKCVLKAGPGCVQLVESRRKQRGLRVSIIVSRCLATGGSSKTRFLTQARSCRGRIGLRIHFRIQWPTSAVGTIGREIFGRIRIATVLGSAMMSPGKRESDSAHDGLDTPMMDKYFEGLVTLALNEESTSMAEKPGGDESRLWKTEQGIAKRKATQTVGLCV